MPEDEFLWDERYVLDLGLLPKFIDREVAVKIFTIGKAINFLRSLCGDSEWIMGPMARVSWSSFWSRCRMWCLCSYSHSRSC